MLLTAILDQDLSRAHQIARRARDADEVEAALLAGVGPLDLIARPVLDRERGRPGCQRTTRRPTQLLRGAVRSVDLDRRRSLTVGPPQLHLRCVADADFAALADVDVPDARVVRDLGRAERTEAAALARRRSERHLLGVKAARATERLGAGGTEHGHDIAALKRNFCGLREGLARRIGLRRWAKRLHDYDIGCSDRRPKSERDRCAPQHCLTHHPSSSFQFAKFEFPASPIRRRPSRLQCRFAGKLCLDCNAVN